MDSLDERYVLLSGLCQERRNRAWRLLNLRPDIAKAGLIASMLSPARRRALLPSTDGFSLHSIPIAGVMTTLDDG